MVCNMVCYVMFKKKSFITCGGSLFLDGGIDVADKVFGEALFKDEPAMLDVWVNVPLHPLQVCIIIMNNNRYFVKLLF